MKCEKCLEQLVAYKENLLDKQDQEEVLKHLEQCESCKSALQQINTLSDRLFKDAKALSETNMENQVMDRIFREQAIKLKRPGILRKLAAIAAVLLIAFFLYQGLDPQKEEPAKPKIDDWVLNQTPVESTVQQNLPSQIKQNLSSLGYSSGGGGYKGPAQEAALVRHLAHHSVKFSAGIGFSVGGAKDILNFRENLNKGFLPLPSDITCEGLFYDYFFDTGDSYQCEDLFYPSYLSAVTKDPVSKIPETYLAVGLNSGLQGFQRKKLNLVIVLDISGSMDSPFDKYHYDKDATEEENQIAGKKLKITLAQESLIGLVEQLKDHDRFGMVVFADQAQLAKPLRSIKETDLDKIYSHIRNLKADGGTNMASGMDLGASLFDPFEKTDPDAYENRIIFLTDAMPNQGDFSDKGLLSLMEQNASKGIFTSFVGIGLDFNSTLVERITKVKGANYHSVHNAKEFKTKMVDQFDYMVTPLVFDLKLVLESGGYEIDRVFGSPEADQATGMLMKINTLFPSPKKENRTKGGVVLLKLKKKPGARDEEIFLAVKYKDRSGASHSSSRTIRLSTEQAEHFDNNGVRKAVLLSRYAALLQSWLIDERRDLIPETAYEFRPEEKDCIILPTQGLAFPPKHLVVSMASWERKSRPISISKPYKGLLKDFCDYMEKEAKAIGDKTLDQEIQLLKKLDPAK